MEVIIEVLLILIYSLTYLCFGVSGLDFRFSGVVNGLNRGVSVPRHFLNDTNILYITHATCAIIWNIIKIALILFYSLTYLRSSVLELGFWRSGVVNGLLRGVLVPRHFLNDTNILYISHLMFANTWKS